MQKLQKGDWVGVRGPFGTRLAGRPGRTATTSSSSRAASASRRSGRRSTTCSRTAALYGRVVLLYGARTPRDMLFPKELREWRSRFDVEVDVTVDRATMEWQGDVGVVTTLVAALALRPAAAPWPSSAGPR